MRTPRENALRFSRNGRKRCRCEIPLIRSFAMYSSNAEERHFCLALSTLKRAVLYTGIHARNNCSFSQNTNIFFFVKKEYLWLLFLSKNAMQVFNLNYHTLCSCKKYRKIEDPSRVLSKIQSVFSHVVSRGRGYTCHESSLVSGEIQRQN